MAKKKESKKPVSKTIDEKEKKAEKSVKPKKEKSPLDIAIASLEKKYGSGVAMVMSERDDLEADTISSGSIGLDIALNKGGFARSRLYEIFGPPSSGKSSISMSLIAQAQRRGIEALYIDAEHSVDPTLFEKMGVDTSRLMHVRESTGEENLDVAETLIKTGAFGVVVIDSVSALIPQAESEGDIDADFMALLARLMSKCCRRLVPIASKTNTVLVFINQLRSNLKRWMAVEDTTGGQSLKYYATGRISVEGGKYKNTHIEKDGRVIGHTTSFNVVKNKLGPPFIPAKVDLIYGVGYDLLGEAFDMAVDLGVVDQSGSWYSYEEEKLGQGKDNALIALREDKALYDKVYNTVIDRSGLREFYDKHYIVDTI